MSTNVVLTLADGQRTVLPQEIRESEGLDPQDKLIIFRDENGMTLMTRSQLQDKLWAKIKDPEKSLVDELIADRRAEAQRDLEETNVIF